ncbi:MAG: methionine--tRNA ligase subunit beta, partial [Bacillota bacterium]|nr:methionine--tRNA ligase subunit beta [Bacillota bacterium]
DWGIQVPINEKHVIYVWFDALTNYYSALGPGSERCEKFWPCDVHLVGKDIVRFHTIIWPIILMAAEIELPKKVFGHGWLLLSEGKMSKSKGNVVDPNVLIDKYGVDAIRYFLLRDMPFGQDGQYSEEALVKRINTDLANDFGNLLSRSTSMIDKFGEGQIPTPGPVTELEQEIVGLAKEITTQVDLLMERLELNNALTAIWRLVGRANKYIDEVAPWALAKDPSKRDYLDTVLYTLAEVIRIVTILATPFMPRLADKVWIQLGIEKEIDAHSWESTKAWGGIPTGTKINRGEPIFPRIDLATLELNEEEQPGKSKEQEGKSVKAEVKNTDTEEIPGVAQISIEDFFKVDLRVAEVINCEKVPKADKLLKLQLKVGQEERTVVSGIAMHYQPDELIGKKVILVANLKPAKLRGIESQGMILAASDDKGNLEVVTIASGLESGSVVK